MGAFEQDGYRKRSIDAGSAQNGCFDKYFGAWRCFSMDDEREDKRFERPNADAIIGLRKKRRWTIDQAKDKADEIGVIISKATLRRVEKNECEPRRMETITAVAKLYGAEPRDIILPSVADDAGVQPFPAAADVLNPTSIKEYTWDHLLRGAAKVASEIFEDKKPLFDAVLTFPGPSSIFCGLVLARMPHKVFMPIPVYTAIFLPRETPVSQKRKQYFHVVKVGIFKVLVPKELIDRRSKKIVVIDDTILTGNTMRELRKFFVKHHDPRNVKFACCICDDRRLLPGKERPEILTYIETRPRFAMPWGRDSFCFEDPFLPSDSHSNEPDNITGREEVAGDTCDSRG